MSYEGVGVWNLYVWTYRMENMPKSGAKIQLCSPISGIKEDDYSCRENISRNFVENSNIHESSFKISCANIGI